MPHRRRLGGFVALSVALHLLTLLGAGPLDLSARRLGDAPGRTELRATLAPAEPVYSRTTDGSGVATDNAPELAAGASAAHAGPAGDEGGLAMPAADRWYTAREVDVRAEPLTDIKLSYPENLRGEPVVGRVRVRLFIDERGVVRKIQIADSRPAGLFDEAAKHTWEEVRFSPALKNGAPVKSQKLLELIYQPGLM